jgi:hypothetical protein
MHHEKYQRQHQEYVHQKTGDVKRHEGEYPNKHENQRKKQK